MDGNPEVMPILDETIRKAIKNGWYFKFEPVKETEPPSTLKAESFSIKNLVLTVNFTNGAGRIWPCVDMVIFDHSFAKAFWGEELLFCGVPIKDLPVDPEDQLFQTKSLSVKAWTYHLPTMVLKENPIQYLKKFL